MVKVFTVDPVPDTAKLMKFNIKLNKLSNIIIIGKAGYYSYRRLKTKIAFSLFGCASFFRT
jgi:tRNA G37 N-methylase Trm5